MQERVGVQGADRRYVAGIEELACECRTRGFGGKDRMGQNPLQGDVAGDGEIIG